MEEIRLKARAKINLTLDVTGKRDNGYHELQMIMQTVGLYDEIVLRKIAIWLGVRQNSCAAPTTSRKAF